MQSFCGADCQNCGYGKNEGCRGCKETNGCPFGKSCFVAKMIGYGGKEAFARFQDQLLDEINALGVEGMPLITELLPLNGAFVNLAYPMPNGVSYKLLDDDAIYLGTQVECLFDDGSTGRCFGVVAAPDFLLVSEYGANGFDPQLVVYKRR